MMMMMMMNIFRSLRSTKSFNLKSTLVDLITKNCADRISKTRSLTKAEKVAQIKEKSGAISELAEALFEQLTNEERKFSGNNKTVRYSPRTISIAMSIFQRSQKAYSELRDRDKSRVWPSISHLSTLRGSRRHNSGNNSDQYVDARETCIATRGGFIGMDGEIICDECKIVGNLVFNSHNHNIEGLTDDGNDMDTLTDLLFDNVDTGDNASRNVATSVNLWKYRQIGGGTNHFSFICEHFFNCLWTRSCASGFPAPPRGASRLGRPPFPVASLSPAPRSAPCDPPPSTGASDFSE